MALTNGVGGAFIFSEDPERLARWYERAFGLDLERYGANTFGVTFAAVSPSDHAVVRETVFSIMQAKAPVPRMPVNADPGDTYGDQPFMVNFRVDDLDEALDHMEAQGIEPLHRLDEDYGRFAWIRDPDGNRVELWQPLKSFTAP